jgi:uncharacterized protein YeaO (DUF488 family)
MVQLKRVYEAASPTDGFRVLVERLWPRGLTKKRAAVDLWLKEIAPSAELRKWYGHEPDRWPEFQKRYRHELHDKQDLIRLLKEKARQGTLTLLFAARDEERNSAVVLMSPSPGPSRLTVITQPQSSFAMA